MGKWAMFWLFSIFPELSLFDQKIRELLRYCNIIMLVTYIVATIRVDPSVLVFLAIISESVNNQYYNPYIFGKIFSRSFQKGMGCIASIVYRFRNNRQTHKHRRLNSYRSD